MKFKNINNDEAGYMLLESLITLVLITSILVLFFPLITDWFTLRNDEKHKVEQTRLLYEQSMTWASETVTEKRTARNVTYQITSKANEIKVTNGSKEEGVRIYNASFE